MVCSSALFKWNDMCAFFLPLLLNSALRKLKYVEPVALVSSLSRCSILYHRLSQNFAIYSSVDRLLPFSHLLSQ